MESSEAAVAFSALSQDARLNLMRLLIAEGPTGMPAGDLASRLRLPASTTSFHLAALERAGLPNRPGKAVRSFMRCASPACGDCSAFSLKPAAADAPNCVAILRVSFPHGRTRTSA